VTQRRPWLPLLCLLLGACGDDLAPSDPDAAPLPPPPPIDGGADPGAPDATPDTTPDATPDAAIPVVVNRVVLDGVPDVQIRQGGTATLVIEGTGLLGVGRVSIDEPIGLHPISRDDHELRFELAIPHGHAPGDVGLRLDTAAGTVARAAALTVTPFVHAVDGRPDGRGTYSSPLRACRGDDAWLQMQRTDTMLLLAGTYGCTDRLTVRRGVIVRGEGPRRTVLLAAGVYTVGDFYGTTEIRDLSLTEVDGFAVIWLSRGNAIIDNVHIHDVRATGIFSEEEVTVAISRYSYRNPDATGVAVFHPRARVTVTNSKIGPAYRGVLVGAGRADLAGTYITDASVGVVAGREGQHGDGGVVTMTGGTITGTTAVTAHDGSVTLDGTELTATGAYRWTGIEVTTAAVELRDTSVRGWDVGVLLLDWRSEPSSLRLDGATIDGNDAGISALASSLDVLTIRRSEIRGGRSALTLGGAPRLVDLGTAADPGANALVSEGYALDDYRIDPGAAVELVGTTLNGQTIQGVVDGPADAPPQYRLRAANQLRF
jgi:hypothetical protein